MKKSKNSFVLLLCAVCVLSGCFGGLKKNKIVKHPDSPMLIQEVDCDQVKVAIYDKENNRMIEYGWVELDDLMIGWTITKYDWQSFIKRKSK